LNKTTDVYDDSLGVPLSEQKCEIVRSELRSIVSSPYFKNSKRYPAFLTYIVEKAICGKASDLKERTIGIEVFGRTADYDTNTDPTVRNTAGEVRKRISLYYAEAPPDTQVFIGLPLGSYHPELRFTVSTIESASMEPAGLVGSQKPAAEIPTSSQRTRLKPFYWIVPVLLLAVTGGLWWFVVDMRDTPLQKFWSGFLNPSQTVLIGTPLAPAPAALDGPFMKGPIDEKYLSNWIKDNPDVAAEDVSAIIHATKPLMEHDVPYNILMDPRITLTDLRDRPVILIGGPSNTWTTKLLASLRFHFSMKGGLHIEDSQNPDALQWGYILSKADSAHVSVVEDCSIIARFHDPTTGGIVMILAGAGRNGTEAAGEFVTSKALLEQLNRRLPPGWKNKNLEIVLNTKVIDGKTGSPSIEATHIW
jgi:hypothetical protein